MLLSSWNPGCPECGYPLRGLTGPRCPECGIEFPTAGRTFRRWAFRRVAWDRKRGPYVPAYFATLFAIVFAPWRASPGLSIPDNWLRCIRWSAVHLLLAAVACALIANGQVFIRWACYAVWPPVREPVVASAQIIDTPAGYMVLWLMQSIAAWAVLFAVPVVLAVGVSVGLPGRHRAAKLGGVKWSLYLVSLIWLPVLAWSIYYAVWPPASLPILSRVPNVLAPAPDLPAIAWAGVYFVWWSIGMGANPYARARGVMVMLAYGLLLAVVWYIVAMLLFPVGALGELL